jgi:hypothetical protein
VKNRKILLAVVASVIAAGIVTGVLVVALTTGKKKSEEKAESEGQIVTGIKDPRGRDLPFPNPENTVVPPQDVQPPGNEPIFIPKEEMPKQEVPPDKSAAIKTSGGIRETETSDPPVICSPMPTTTYWVEIENAKLGDRTWRANFTIENFHGNGVYKVPVGMAMRYPDGQLTPFADGEAEVEILDGGARGIVRAQMFFLEGLTSVSFSYRCGGPAAG